MILRRPYAFLIKNFRLIHIILFILLAYTTYHANNMLSFFKEYIRVNGSIEVISSQYITAFIYIIPVIIIILSLTIFFLMKYKKKPRLFYVILILVIIICTGIYSYLYFNIKTLETTIMSAREIRLLRDISRANFYILFITCIPLLIRGLGFDIKKFNFTNDLKELNLSKEDSEEVEVSIDMSSNGLKRAGRKTIRELKYYYAENKLFINIILAVITIILIIIFPFNKYVIKKNLQEGEVLGSNDFNIKINNSYITDRHHVSKNNSYIIIKVSVLGKTNNYTLNLEHFVLESNNNKYIPSKKYYLYFNDLGRGYREEILNTKEYENYLFIYNINSSDKESKFILNYIDNNKKIVVKPSKID